MSLSDLASLTPAMRSNRNIRALAGILLVLVACFDEPNPLGPDGPEKPGRPADPRDAIALTCRADVKAMSMQCMETPPPGTGSSADIIIGGQNVSVRLNSANLAYAGGIFSADVSVTNLMDGQIIGSSDGVTPSPTRVFFHDGPNGTGGSVAVHDDGGGPGDGAATFTAAGQIYYEYSDILEFEETSAIREWEFDVPAEVTQFTFQVYVSAAVRYPNGWVQVDPASAVLDPAQTLQLVDSVFDRLRRHQDAKVVTWSSSDPAVASVDASTGLVTANANGTATITASVTPGGGGIADGTATITVNAAPVAVDDAVDAFGNVTLSRTAAQGVLANDAAPEGGQTHTATAVSSTTDEGGTFTVASDGSYTYLSAPGYTGADTARYVVSDGVEADTAKLVITVAGRVWYVRNNATAPGDGRDTSPFTALADAVTAASTGERILILVGDGTTAGMDAGVTLKDGQSLIGQGVASDVTTTLNGDPLVLLAAGTHPKIGRATAGAAITLAQNDSLRGIEIVPSDGAAVLGASFGSVFLRDSRIAAVGGAALDLTTGTVDGELATLSSSGAATGLNLVGIGGSLSATGGLLQTSTTTGVNVSGGDATLALANAVSNAAGRTVAVSGRTGGTVDFSGSVTATGGTGILLQNNTAGTVAFSGSAKSLSTGANAALTISGNSAGTAFDFTGGGLALQTTSAAGISFGGDGTVTVAGANNTIETGAGTAISGDTFGTLNLEMQQVQSLSGTALDLRAGTVGGAGITDLYSTDGGKGVNLENLAGTLTVAGGTVSGATQAGLRVQGGAGIIDFGADISSPTDSAVAIFGRSGGTVTVSGTITQGSAGSPVGRGIWVRDGSGAAAVTFSGSTKELFTGANTAVTVTGNASGNTVGFTGGNLDLHTTTATALNFSGAGAVTVSGTGNSIETTTGAGVNHTGAGSLTFADANPVISTGLGTGVSFGGAGTLAFTGTAGSVTTTGGTAVFGLNFGTLNVSNLTASATGGTAVDLRTGTVGGTGFTSVTSSGGAKGVNLESLAGSLTVAGGSVTGSTQAGLRVFAGEGDVTFAASVSTPVDTAVAISNRTGGTVDVQGSVTQVTPTATTRGIFVRGGANAAAVIFSGAAKTLTTGANPALTVSGNAAGNAITFSNGNLDLTTTTATGMDVSGAGAVTVSGAGNSITTTSGAALDHSSTGSVTFSSGIPIATGSGAGVSFDANGTLAFTGTGHSITTTGGTGMFGLNFGTLDVNGLSVGVTNGAGLDLTRGAGSGTVSGTGITNLTAGTTATGVSLNGIAGSLTVAAGSISGTTTRALYITGGDANVAFAPNLSATAGRLVEVASRTGGTATLSGTLSSTVAGTGLLLSGNSGTINFTNASQTLSTGTNAALTVSTNGAAVNFTGGALAITTTSGAGFNASGGGTVTVTGATNTVTTTTGTPVSISGTTIGGTGVTFRSVNSAGAANGIVLANTGAGVFTVAGNGGTCTVASPTCTGGYILNSSGAGVSLTSAHAVLTRLRVHGSGSHGITATGTGNLTLNSSYLQSNGNGDEENGLNISSLAGTVLIDASAFHGAAENLIRVDNNNANLTFTVQNSSTFSYPNPESSAFRNSAILITPKGSSAITATVTSSTFTNIPVSSFQAAPDASSTATSTYTFTNNTISADVGLNVTCASNSQCRVGNVVAGGTGGITNFIATGNSFNRVNGDGVFILGANQSSTLRTRIETNTISNAMDDAFVVGLGQSARVIAQFNANTITNIGADALEVASGETNAAFGAGTASDMDLVFTNNVMSNVGTNNSLVATGGPGIFRFGDADQLLCLAFTGNSVSPTPATTGISAYLDGNFGGLGGSMTYERAGSGALTDAMVKADNPGLDQAGIIVSGVTLSNGATCTRPGI